LNAAHRLLLKEPQDAQKRLLDIQKMIFEEQQSIRSHIRLLKSPHLSLPKWDLDLPKRLQELAERINSQWGMRVAIGENLNFTKLPWAMTQEVYFIIHEALINAARHADASFVWAEIGSTDQSINIVVTDDGRGFTFTGCHDHATLIENNLGPVVLRERVTSLGGSLFVESGSSGARLEINLPIPESMN
jgi:signal transduction histidine kinase